MKWLTLALPIPEWGGRPVIRIDYVITRGDVSGGAQNHVLTLAHAALQAGYNIRVLTGGKGLVFASLKELGVPCVELKCLVHPISPIKDLAALVELYRVLKEKRPDLVTTHSSKAGFIGRLAARLLGVKAVHTSHGWLFAAENNSIKEKLYLALERYAARCTRYLIAVSEADSKIAVRVKLAPAEQIKVIHNGIEPGFNLPRARPEINPPQLVMVARFEEPKDHVTLLEALVGLLHKEWRLLLVGGGSRLADCRHFVAQLGLQQRVTFTGEVADCAPLLSESQIFILSSKREGFPISVLEAMRAGLPVVASNTGGISEAVKHGATGFLFTPGKSSELYDLLAILIQDTALRKKMGNQGRELLAENFTLTNMARKTFALYEEIVNDV